MKKSIMALLALSLCGSALADSLILKPRDLTPKERKTLEESGDFENALYRFQATDKGVFSIFTADSDAADMFDYAARNKRCVKFTASKEAVKAMLKDKYIHSTHYEALYHSDVDVEVVKCPHK